MVLKQCFLTNNITYKKQTPIKPVGIVVHSTGCTNTWLGRWVQPSDDDPNRAEILADIGENRNGNSWNRSDCDTLVHAMIGLNLAGEVEVYQTLEFDRKCGGCYHGVNGSYNNTHIQFEIQEDNLANEDYFHRTVDAAVEFCAYLCKTYGISPANICSHYEAAERGYASFHVDPTNWWSRYNYTMNDFRREVEEEIGMVQFKRGDIVQVKEGVTTNYAGTTLASWVIDGRPLYVYDSDYELTKITVDPTLSAVTATMNTADIELVSEDPEEEVPGLEGTITILNNEDCAADEVIISADEYDELVKCRDLIDTLKAVLHEIQ